MELKCKCNECAEVFNEKDLHEITYTEYPGARAWKESVSPCCHASFIELD